MIVHFWLRVVTSDDVHDTRALSMMQSVRVNLTKRLNVWCGGGQSNSSSSSSSSSSSILCAHSHTGGELVRLIARRCLINCLRKRSAT